MTISKAFFTDFYQSIFLAVLRLRQKLVRLNIRTSIVRVTLGKHLLGRPLICWVFRTELGITQISNLAQFNLNTITIANKNVFWARCIRPIDSTPTKE